MSTATPTKPDNGSSPDSTQSQSPDLLHDESTGSLRSRFQPDYFRTAQFVAGAIVCMAITAVFEFSSRPAEIQDFGKVGEEFYADFTDPTRATSLEVYVFDADSVKLQDFRVERLDNGRWVIPSHHNYPADAEDQLAKTASSIIGIKRGAMVTRWESDHSRYGVVNPRQNSLNVKEVEGVGSRIILKGSNDTLLADYIIGNKVDGEFDQYYVRHPEEDEVYIAELDIDLSTRFTDWIETDLLDVDRDDVIALTLNDYSFDELKGQITGREVSSLTRKKYSDPWQLDGLNEETEEIDKDRIRAIVNSLSDLEIAGVRPKQKGLTPELTLDRSVIRSQNDVDRIQTDLLARGFVLQPAEGDENRLRLIAREGELSAATKDGLVYHLHFGRIFTGSQEELETGFATSSESASVAEKPDSEISGDQPATANDTDAAPSEPAVDSNDNATDGNADSDETESDHAASDEKKQVEHSDSSKPGRYAFVRVDFDEKWLGDEPVKPVEPEKPEALVDAEASSGAQNQTSDSSTQKADSTVDSTSDVSDATESEEDPLATIRKEYEDDKSQYESDLAEYERKKKERDRKIEEGRKKAEELNRRFAEWYYVIPGDDFDRITLARTEIVKPKKSDSQAVSDEQKDASDNKNAAAESQQPASDNQPRAAARTDEENDSTTDEESSAAESSSATEDSTEKKESPVTGKLDEAENDRADNGDEEVSGNPATSSQPSSDE